MPFDAGHWLGHAFQRPELLQQALTHRSAGPEHNERLEFIGDAVLDCAIARLIYERFPDMSEGELSRVRANLVNRDTLHRLALALDLGGHVRLGAGEIRSGGAARASILADALEALFGAVFIDAGFDCASASVAHVYAAELAQIDLGAAKDPKTRLQEWLQARRLALPEYSIVAVNGEAHVQSFDVMCRIPGMGIEAHGSGPSRRAAEQAAASRAYEEASTR